MCYLGVSIFHEITSYRTIWRPPLSHTTCAFQLSNYHLLAILFECHFCPTCERESLHLLLKSLYATDSIDSNNWTSLPLTYLQFFHFRIIVKGRIIGWNYRDKKISESTLEMTSLSFLHSSLCVKKLISPVIDFCTLLLRERTWHRKFDGTKVVGQFPACLEAATRKCPPKQFFFWSWINPWNYFWTCMLMLNFSNKELVQKYLVQVISCNWIPGIGINIL